MSDIITITDACISKVKELIKEENILELKLRVFVQGGGCHGLQYGFTFEENLSEDDIVITKDGVDFLIDMMSYQYLAGANIDCVEDTYGAQFVIKNPNSSSVCGCGQSFNA